MRFCSGQKKSWGAAPFSLKVEKTPWTVGADGFMLFAVKMAGAKTRKDYPDELPSMLSAAPIDPVEIDVAALKVWAGEPPKVPVPAGDVDHEHQGVLLGFAIDRRKLAYLMANVTLPKINVWVLRPNVLAFEHPQRQWRALLSCLAQKPDGDEPVFNTSAAVTIPAPTSVLDMIADLDTE
jgi:hypothetical protein